MNTMVNITYKVCITNNKCKDRLWRYRFLAMGICRLCTGHETNLCKVARDPE